MNAIQLWIETVFEKLIAQKRMFLVWVIGAYTLFSLVALGLSFYSTTIFGMDWNWGLAMFLAIVLYTIASLRTIGPTELGARILFGKPMDNVYSGFVFVPFGIFELKTASRLVIQSELPANPEHIFHGEGETPAGKFPPIRIPFGPPNKGDGIPDDDPVNARMVAEVVPVISWLINDFVRFLTTVGDIDEAKRQMEDASVAMITEAFAKITPAAALRDLEVHSQNLKEAIDKRVDRDEETRWGIDLKSAKIKAINFSHDLNTAILGIPQATVKAKAVTITAEGEKVKRRLEGEGAGAAEQAVLEGRTTGLKKMMDDLGLSGQVILGAETARGVTNNPGQKTIIVGADGFSKLAAVAGTVLEETLSRKGA